MGSHFGGKIAVQTQTFDIKQQEELLMTTQATTSRTNRNTNRGNKVTVTPEMVRQAVEKMQQEQPTVYKRPPMSEETKRKIAEAQVRAHARKRGVAMPIATNGKFTNHIDTVIATIKNLPWSFQPNQEELEKVEELKVMLESFTKHFGKK